MPEGCSSCSLKERCAIGATPLQRDSLQHKGISLEFDSLKFIKYTFFLFFVPSFLFIACLYLFKSWGRFYLFFPWGAIFGYFLIGRKFFKGVKFFK